MRLFSLILLLASIVPSALAAPTFVFTKTDLQFLDECAALDRRFDADGLIYHDTAFEKHLSALAAPLLPQPEPERVEWRFRILRDPGAGAFALPNGSVYLRAGLLARLENDAQLAGVLAHQIAHVTARHGYLERRAFRGAAAIMNAATFVGFGAIGVLATSGVMTPASALIFSDGYKSDFEQAADLAALDALHTLGKDQAQYLRLLNMFAEPLDPDAQLVTSRDYAKPQQRAARLRARFPTLAAATDTGADGYLERAAAAIAHDVPLAIEARRFHSAVAAAERLATAHPGNVEALVLLGQAYYATGPRAARPTGDEAKETAQRNAKRETQQETAEEESRRLAATGEGRANLAANYGKAEEWFQKAAALAPASPQPHLGLGILYQDQGKREMAIAEYKKFLELAPTADRPRVERRLAELSAEGTQK
jgi:tetratricopeptide (TPR) repeat protein